MNRWVRPGGVAVVLLLAAACGNDSDDSGETVTRAEGTDEQEAPDAAGDDLGGCLLDADSVSQAAGVTVDMDSWTVGGTGAGGAETTLDESGIDVTREDGFSVGWEGCTYVADDGTKYLVGELVDEAGAPDLAGFDQLVSWATAEPDEAIPPAVGDAALVDGDELVVQDAGRTLVVGFGFGATTGADDDIAGLGDIAEAMITFGSDDLVTTCAEGFAAAPPAWGEPSPPLAGGGGGSIDGVEYSYESCSTDYPAVGMVEVKIGDADLYDLRAGSSAGAGDGEEDVPEMVPGIGDTAVRMSGNLYVRVGEQGAVVYARTPDGESLDPEPVDALGTAVAASLD